LPDYGHLRHIMTELTKFVFFRKVLSNLVDGNYDDVAMRLYSPFRTNQNRQNFLFDKFTNMELSAS
jgi:hypothetical protein